jgi:hypothetical protein
MHSLCRQALWAAVAGIAFSTAASSALLAQEAGAQPQQEAGAQQAQQDDGNRLTLQDLHPGATLQQMPDWLAFRNYACGSNGGPPLRKLSGWSDFKLCKPDENGLYEVYFEYDNEAEYILRAHDDPRATHFAGTTEQGFPVVTSALFSEDGVLRGLRMVTDPRADYTTADHFFDLTDLRTRGDFYLLGPFVGGQVGINPSRDCTMLPLAEGESKIGNTYVKLDCERIQDGLRYLLKTRYFRKPGQLARDPVSGNLTEGQYESSTVFEEYQVGYGPSPLRETDKATDATADSKE